MAARTKPPAARNGDEQAAPVKLRPWGTENAELPQYVMNDLRQVYYLLDKDTRERLGLMMKVPVFITDPMVALEQPELGVQEIDVRLEVGFGDGPTSSRIAVVDFNGDMQQLTPPVTWDPKVGWFRTPAGDLLPEAPRGPGGKKTAEKTAAYRAAWQEFLDRTIKNPHFHQMNAWAVVQRVLEFYQEPQALGRPIPWGFDGNRLIVVPHAGYGENAFYDRSSKSLQFYYFGDLEHPGYTCLAHDIITHETGHAVLDGIRPLYNQSMSVQTPAFHEFIGDLTAIMLALFNKDILHFVARTTQGDFQAADVLSNLAEQFGREVEGRPYLRTARNDLTMDAVRGSVSPHNISQVLTGAMFDILIGIGKVYAARNVAEAPEAAPQAPEDAEDSGAAAEPQAQAARSATPGQIVWRSADRFRRVALQPLDLCPPCDIQFLDYAAAVLHNDLLTNPVDKDGYRQVMLDVFHKRKICSCGYDGATYRIDKKLPRDCQFREALSIPEMKFFYHNIDRIASSRTAAYNFLSDNRNVLRIPQHQDVVVVDLYDNSKLGAAAERLPREIVLEYVWQEEVQLKNDPARQFDFGQYADKFVNMYCGGTLVFDDRGNLLSWFRKPGTEHITPERAEELRQNLELIKQDPAEAKRRKIKVTKQQRWTLEDFDEGKSRKDALLAYTADAIARGLVGQSQLANPFLDGAKPIAAVEENGVLRLETTPHLRTGDFDTEVEGWQINF